MKIKRTISPTIKYRRMRMIAAALAAVTVLALIEAAYINVRCLTFKKDYQAQIRQNEFLERQNMQYQEYINEVNLGNGERND